MKCNQRKIRKNRLVSLKEKVHDGLTILLLDEIDIFEVEILN